MTDHPSWLLQLVAAVEHYEDCHGHPDDSWTCLRSSLLPVPTEVWSEPLVIDLGAERCWPKWLHDTQEHTRGC